MTYAQDCQRGRIEAARLINRMEVEPDAGPFAITAALERYESETEGFKRGFEIALWGELSREPS